MEYDNSVDLALARMDMNEKADMKVKIHDEVFSGLNALEQNEIELIENTWSARMRGFGERSAKELMVSLGIAIEKRMRHVEAKKKQKAKNE